METMKQRIGLGSLALAALLATALPVAADPWMGPEPEAAEKERVEKRVTRVVMVDDKGERDEKVFEWSGTGAPRGYLGVGLVDLTPELLTHFGVSGDKGVLISSVEPGSPAEKAGIKVGDVLTSIDGKAADSQWQVRMQIRHQEDNATVPVEIWRGGKVQNLSATLEKRERPEVDLAPMFFKHKEGDQLMLHLKDGEFPKAFQMQLPDGAKMAPGQRMRVERFQGREAELEKRLKVLEKRIQDLEKQLQKR